MKLSSFLTLLLLCLFAVAAIVGYGYYRFGKRVGNSREDLVSAAGKADAASYDFLSPDYLPEPVRRYHDFALGADPERPKLMELVTAGDFHVPLLNARRPIQSHLISYIGDSAFVHDAKITVFPGIWINFLDIYQRNRYEARKMVNYVLDTQIIKEDRYVEDYLLGFWLLTAALNPAVLLSTEKVAWEELDGASATLTLSASSGASASATATFGPDGALAALELEKSIQMLPNMPPVRRVEVGSYDRQAGVMIPAAFTFTSAAADGAVVVWQGKVVRVRAG